MTTTPPSPAPFDLGIDLTTHPRIALGASAGTGKTYTLQALAVRNLIEGHCTIGELLMVTFTKAAAAEMRQRLVSALEQAVAICGPTVPADADPGLVALLRVDDMAEMAARAGRAQQALADIDQAVVTTLDSFWSMMVKWLDIAPEGELDAVDEDFVVRSTLNHFLIKAAATYEQLPAMPSQTVGAKVVREMFNVPDTQLDLEAINLTSTPAAAIGGLAMRSVATAKAIREQGNAYTYSDVLDALDAYVSIAPEDPAYETHREHIQKLISQFNVVMVDEVQDTNQAQLSLLKKLFADTPIHLYLVGDPKQAIYEFRGGDINAWDDARDWVETGGKADVDASFDLGVNYRSDGPVVEAINTLFAGQRFSYSTTFAPVTASHASPRIHTPTGPLVPCVLRQVEAKGNKDELIVATITDVVRYCATLLTGEITITDSANGEPRPITPGDISVLVRRNNDIFKLNNALQSRGIPALMASGNVMQSEAATYWLDLLDALAERPDPGALTALTVGPWLRGSPMGAEQIWTLTLEWRQILERFGPGALMEAVDHSTGFAGNLLAKPDGRRLLTDLEHVGELLDASGEWGRRRWYDWLTRARHSYNLRAEEERRRLDLDGGAVELRTSHSAKGLERPIVLVPFAWINSTRQAMSIPRLYYRQDATDKKRYDRYLNVDATADMSPLVGEAVLSAARFANTRLCYVEATRAKHHVVLWHEETRDGLNTVADLVAGALGDAQQRGHEVRLGAATGFLSGAGELARLYPERFAAQLARHDDPIPHADLANRGAGARGAAPLPARAGFVEIDMDWRRSSFSGWVSEQDDTDGAVFDEPDMASGDETSVDDGVAGDAVALTVMPSGAEMGTTVHSIYEVLDFQDPNARKEIRRILGEQLAGPLTDLEPGVLDQIALGLDQVLHTPLGGPLGALRLADVPRALRADEMAYEFSVQSEGGPGVSLAQLGQLWAANIADDDPFAGYANRLADIGDDRPLRGYLLGFIDLVLQHEHPDGRVTWTVMDYKTNRIAIPGVEVLRQGHYQAANLRAEMEVHHYPLQALLYQVALHRYLRASLVGYDPAVHLGGAAYLFVRGMSGAPSEAVAHAVAEGEAGPGVMWWTPGAALIEAVDRAFVGEG